MVTDDYWCKGRKEWIETDTLSTPTQLIFPSSLSGTSRIVFVFYTWVFKSIRRSGPIDDLCKGGLPWDWTTF